MPSALSMSLNIKGNCIKDAARLHEELPWLKDTVQTTFKLHQPASAVASNQ